jgi:hypothetical protein
MSSGIPVPESMMSMVTARHRRGGHLRGADQNAAAARHRIGGIRHQVQQHAVQGIGVASHRRQRGGPRHHHLNPPLLKHGIELGYHGTQLGLQIHLRAPRRDRGVRHVAVDQGGHPVNLRLDDGEPTAAGVAEPLNREEPRVSEHRVERGAQIVCDGSEIHGASPPHHSGGARRMVVAAAEATYWKN